MRDLLIKMQVNAALTILGSWYINWELCSSSPYAYLRSHALYSKAKGLVEHDRALRKSIARLEGRSDD